VHPIGIYFASEFNVIIDQQRDVVPVAKLHKRLRIVTALIPITGLVPVLHCLCAATHGGLYRVTKLGATKMLGCYSV
jgi:hypothetical protein